jgi:U3 small nucleolar RNA-associated protein 11
MSSLRNSLHRRNHKERSQLSHRQRFGILEKHKDYVLRARDYHSKQDRIKRLRQKAAERNKDEFYFGMNRERTEVYASSPLRRGTRVLTFRTCVGRRACAGSREC